MQLFQNAFNRNLNLLPKDGCVNYYGQIFDAEEDKLYFEVLLNEIHWRHDEIMIFGKKIITKRKVAWYGDEEFEYTYSKTTKKALPWTMALAEIKKKIEYETGEKFNSCLLNLYHNGNEGMGWHSDAEKDLEENAAIASISFGASRKFIFKHKATKEKIELLLENGSLLLMKNTTQKRYFKGFLNLRKKWNLLIFVRFSFAAPQILVSYLLFA